MARVLVIASDLLLGSRVEETLRAAGHDAERLTETPAASKGYDLVVADLMEAPADRLARLGPPVLGFYAHTEPGIRDRALDSGVDRAVPRSRMARELPQLVDELLGD